ncbi:hypothetical protein ACW9KT_01630 [Hymenobacter sp. HD11105]
MNNSTLRPPATSASLLKHEYGHAVFFLIAFLMFSVHVFTSRYSQQYYDSAVYWSLASSFDANGAQGFSLYNFQNQLRGYLLPLLYYPAVLFTRHGFATDAMVAPKLIGALQAGLLFGAIIPLLWQRITGLAIPPLRRVVFILICFVLWRDHFNFVLTDFPGLLALTVGLLLAYGPRPIWYALGVGMFSAAALYIRPVYIITAPFLFFLLWQQSSLTAGRIVSLSVSARLGLFVLGWVLIGLPQLLINQHNFQSNSFLVHSETGEYQVMGNKNLYLWHLNAGILMQRYETNVGTDYAEPQVVFGDRAGHAIHLRYGGGVQASFLNYIRYGGFVLDSYPAYLRFVAKQPLDMLALYARHLFNGLDVLYASPYVAKVHASTALLSFINYSALFVALLTIARYWHRLRLGAALVIAALVVTSFVAVPTVVECRFFVGLHVVLLAIACFGSTIRLSALRSLPTVRLVAAYGAFLLLCFTFSANTQAALEMEPKTIHPNQQP